MQVYPGTLATQVPEQKEVSIPFKNLYKKEK
jgi:hypothetical protein